MAPYFSSFFELIFNFQSDKKPIIKVGWVLAGYGFALAVAALAAACDAALQGGVNNPNYTGMNAFGDCLLFLAVFGIASIPGGCLALSFLRPYAAFWRTLSRVAFPNALIGLAASCAVILASASAAGAVGFLRVLLAPLFALAFGLSGIFAPNRSTRKALFVAGGIEVAAFTCWIGACLFYFH